MGKILTRGAAPLALLLFWSVPGARAQFNPYRPGSPAGRPPVSPYLNLARPGNSALNYYNLVRPEFEFRNAYQSLQQQLNRQETALSQVAADALPTTGHTTSFLNYSHFYPGVRGQAGQGVARQGTP